ncbi:hypothetical protein ACFVT1_13025 [Streptomyces sp. NPDC057963]|uniref:hypothetical protein n=1 Tax=Streptomyces sp. NPDC057963 TaxID=3346290 RepID=UPI0036E5B76B
MPNSEPELLELIADVLEHQRGRDLGDGLNAGGAALLIAPLVNHGQKVLYIPGRSGHYASGSYAATGRQTRRTPTSSPIGPACDTTLSLWQSGTMCRWT